MVVVVAGILGCVPSPAVRTCPCAKGMREVGCPVSGRNGLEWFACRVESLECGLVSHGSLREEPDACDDARDPDDDCDVRPDVEVLLEDDARDSGVGEGCRHVVGEGTSLA